MRWLHDVLNSVELDEGTPRCQHDLERPQRALVSSFLSTDTPMGVWDDEVVELVATLGTCPFSIEIHDNDRPCWCCQECRYQCSMDI